ncbi:DNA-primase RepB domain-containing protein [uncultured Croceicoccus sp.]|uniref:DNA-primase RepB domain-containing protein n=1 Tax=uncultured Croceicoccus sp. TaxID=1295329 RepID=UPI0026130A1A|nr:DNA-primase RepB domain-containing protein [uncultured Croceicoccus sp.]
MAQAALIPTTAKHIDASDDLTDFLSHAIGDAIHLLAIGAKGWIVGRHFGTDIDAAAAWARRQNARGSNIYFTVNRAADGLHKKPRKDDIDAVRFAHVDIDPKDVDWDRDAAVRALMDGPARPSILIHSGRGLQAFWRVAGADIAQVEAINRALIARFSGDKGTWSSDRMMRLTGTVNHPSAAKRSAGHPAQAARTIHQDGAVWPVGALAQAFDADLDTAPGRRRAPSAPVRVISARYSDFEIRTMRHAAAIFNGLICSPAVMRDIAIAKIARRAIIELELVRDPCLLLLKAMGTAVNACSGIGTRFDKMAAVAMLREAECQLLTLSGARGAIR